jgi:hypothetical protein
MKNQFKILLVSALAALTVVSASCSLLSISTATVTQTSTVTSPATTTTIVSTGVTGSFLDFSSVVDKVRPSVVQVETDIAAGSGWVVDSSG